MSRRLVIEPPGLTPAEAGRLVEQAEAIIDRTPGGLRHVVGVDDLRASMRSLLDFTVTPYPPAKVRQRAEREARRLRRHAAVVGPRIIAMRRDDLADLLAALRAVADATTCRRQQRFENWIGPDDELT